MIVKKTTVFPASRETIFEKLQKLETLVAVVCTAAPH